MPNDLDTLPQLAELYGFAGVKGHRAGPVNKSSGPSNQGLERAANGATPPLGFGAAVRAAGTGAAEPSLSSPSPTPSGTSLTLRPLS